MPFYSKIGVSFASTSSMIDGGTPSSLRALRKARSRARGWSHRTTPVVFVPALISDTAKPAVRAKLPALVIGSTTGVFVSRLKDARDTIRTGRVPCCSWPEAIPGKYRRAPLQQLPTDWLTIQPGKIFRADLSRCVALSYQFVQAVTQA